MLTSQLLTPSDTDMCTSFREISLLFPVFAVNCNAIIHWYSHWFYQYQMSDCTWKRSMRKLWMPFPLQNRHSTMSEVCRGFLWKSNWALKKKSFRNNFCALESEPKLYSVKYTEDFSWLDFFLQSSLFDTMSLSFSLLWCFCAFISSFLFNCLIFLSDLH
jgi:hypothetical protein